MDILRGISVSPGVAIAEAVVLDAEDYRIPLRQVAKSAVDGEVDHLVRAFEASVHELTDQKLHYDKHLGRDAADIFAWHLGVLTASHVREQMIDLIRRQHYSAAYATSMVMRDYQRRFRQVDNPMLAERVRDLQDIERRVLRHILGAAREDLAHLTRPVVLIAHDLPPSQAADLAGAKVVGVGLDIGGAASHTAILLRSLGRPAVVGVKELSSHVSGGDLVIIDGYNDLVILKPDAGTLAQYRDQQRQYVRIRDELSGLRDLDPVTLDGERFRLLANIEFPEEITACVTNGAEGVGLYRTEFLFLGHGEPSEEEQYEAYRSVLSQFGDKPITIRTFDLGADKYSLSPSADPEPNPMLGLRSIRYSLQALDMFKVQLRAILRAAAERDVRLMFPLVNSLMEFRQARMVLHDTIEDLDEAGVSFCRDPRVGIMVETPAAAIQCRDFAREVAFLSLGTNDLVQYVLAVDRGNERVARLYTASHPAVLRLIRDVIRTCTKADIPCSLCGEMAGEPIYTMFLGGLGLREFSMAPHNIPEVKKLIRATRVTHMKRIAKRAMSFETDREVVNYLRSQTKKFLPDDPMI